MIRFSIYSIIVTIINRGMYVAIDIATSFLYFSQQSLVMKLFNVYIDIYQVAISILVYNNS